MFTGIIEELGEVTAVAREGGNLQLRLSARFTPELKVDQSVAHNGVCLTVVGIHGDEEYSVTAIEETLNKTNLGSLLVGQRVNLERGMQLGARLDGHLVQGHVDQTATCTAHDKREGSDIFSFRYDPSLGNLTIEKGSITVNGVSLTVVNSGPDHFSVAIIPYTLEHTGFGNLQVGELVNLEFDVIGKYVRRLTELGRD